MEEELLRKDEALDDGQHQLQERGSDGSGFRSMMQAAQGTQGTQHPKKVSMFLCVATPPGVAELAAATGDQGGACTGY